MKLIHLCFEKDLKLYRKAQFIYKLGGKLRVSGEDVVKRHNMLTEKLAHVAIAVSFFGFYSFSVGYYLPQSNFSW